VSIRRLAARAAAVSVLVAATALAGSGTAPAALAGGAPAAGDLSPAPSSSSSPTFAPSDFKSLAVTPSVAVAADLTTFQLSGTVNASDTFQSVTATVACPTGCSTSQTIPATPGQPTPVPDDNGNFTEVFKVPAVFNTCPLETAVEALTVDVTLVIQDGPTDEEKFPISAFCPSITVSPKQVLGKDEPVSYTVSPTGFPKADGTFTLTIDGQQQTNFTTDKNGDLHFTASPVCNSPHAVEVSENFQENPQPIIASATTPVPAGEPELDSVSARTEGTAPVPAGDGTASATDSFEVFCPSIKVRPPAIDHQSLPATYTVTPTGFPQSESGFTLFIDGTKTPFTTDDSGDVQFTAPAATTCTTHTAELTEGGFNGGETADAQDTFQVLCPSITVSPPAVGKQSLPASYTVTPTGFLPGGTFTLTLDGTPQQFTTDESGNLHFSASPACGPPAHTVTLTQDLGDGQAAVASQDIQVVCPSITVSPPAVGKQSLPASYTVTPTGYLPEGAFTLTVDGTPQKITTDESGDVHFSASPACGIHLVTLTQDLGDGQTAVASADIQVLCPSIKVSPPAVGNQSLPASYTVTPTGFLPEGTFTLTLDSTQQQFTTDDSGNLDFTASPACGTHTVKLTQDLGDGQTAVASQDIQVLCPSIKVSPPAVGSQSLPASYTVTPKGFLPEGTFTLTVDGTPQTFTTDDGGNLTFSASPACGTHTVTLTQDLGDGQTALASQDIQVVCPSITVDPAVVGKQQLPVGFAVTPSGYLPTGAFTLTLDGKPVFATGPGGNLTFVATPACGTHTVTLTQDLGDGQTAVASARITVLCPAITVNPPSFPLAKEPGKVQVTGTQFHSDTPVTITLDGTPAGTTTTDKNGGFRVPVTSKGLDCGAHKVTATEQPAANSSALFGGSAPALSVLFSESAIVSVTNCKLSLTLPPAVVAGEAAQVTGTGFGPGVPVTLTWKLPGASGAALPGTLTLTPDAAGNIDGHFLILPPGMLGPRQALATQGKLKQTADTLVMLWPTQPSPGGQLVYRG
jgi:hypothetical protein